MKENFEKLINGKLFSSKSFQQLVKYGVVGVIGLIIDMGLYFLLVTRYEVHYPFSAGISSLLGGEMSISMIDILISNVISTSIAVVNNFILNSYFTFQVTDRKVKRFLTFATIASVGLVISSALLTLLIGVLDMNELLAKAISVLFVAMLQFFINKLVTFK